MTVPPNLVREWIILTAAGHMMTFVFGFCFD